MTGRELLDLTCSRSRSEPPTSYSARGRFAGALLGLFLAAWAAGCTNTDETVALPRLVLVYIPCTVNADFLQPYNPAIDFTPNLKAFARDGIVFDRHQSEAGQSGVSYAAMFSGKHAEDHGVFTHPMRLPERNYLLTEAFADLGYETFFWGAHAMANARLGYGQGVAPENTFPNRLDAGAPRFQEILEKLRADPSYRAMVVTNFSVTHSPYLGWPVAPFCERFPDECTGLREDGESVWEAIVRSFKIYIPNSRNLASDYPRTVARLGLSEQQIEEMSFTIEVVYRSAIHHLDELFGEVLDAIASAGMNDESVVVFTADHGEVLNRDNALFKWGHGWELAPEVLRVPFIIRAPGLAAGTRYAPLTRSIDLYPTLVALAGHSLPEERRAELTGEDLSPALLGEEPPRELLAYSHTVVMHRMLQNLMGDLELWKRYHQGVGVAEPWISARREDMVFKYRNLDGENWGFQVFDLAADPEERRDLYDPDSPDHREMGKSLLAYRQRLVAAWDAFKGEPVLDDQTKDALRSLGYIE